MRKLADGRIVYIATNGVDPYVDANNLSECVAAIDTDEVSLWNVAGRPMMLENKKWRIVNMDALRELTERFIVVPRLVFISSDEMEIRYDPYLINDREIHYLLSGKSAREGALAFRLPGPLQLPMAPAAPPEPVVQPEPAVQPPPLVGAQRAATAR
jgi:hypothetical protein